jgi:hypothetical protein
VKLGLTIVAAEWFEPWESRCRMAALGCIRRGGEVGCREVNKKRCGVCGVVIVGGLDCRCAWLDFIHETREED